MYLSVPLILAWQLLKHPESKPQITAEDSVKTFGLVPLRRLACEKVLLGFQLPSAPCDESLHNSSKLK